MKVISGSAKGISLEVPVPRSGPVPRPITDRIKESLFSILMWELPSADVLDIFSGSGALGIEALSRGAARAVFVERDRNSAKIINKNLGQTNFFGSGEVVVGDALMAVSRFITSGESFDIIFADPPFPMTEDPGQEVYFVDMWNLLGDGVLKAGGKVVLRCQKGAVIPDMLEVVGSVKKIDEREYGRSVIHIYQRC